MKPYALLGIIGAVALPTISYAAVYDLSVGAANIRTVPQYPIAKQALRVYVSVQNTGERDTEGIIELYEGDRKLGSKPVSVPYGGQPDEVWFAWTPMSIGDRMLYAKIVSDPDTPDENSQNNVGAKEIYVDVDTDEDGFPDRQDEDDDNDLVLDKDDAFPLDPTRQKDLDGDGIDDKADTDIDGDGLSNEEEARLGTDPRKKDSDGDGYNDKEDVYPLDRLHYKAPEPVSPATTTTTVTPTPTASARKPSTTAQASNTSAQNTTSTTDAMAEALPEPVQEVFAPAATTSVLAQLGIDVLDKDEETINKEQAVTLYASDDGSGRWTIRLLWLAAVLGAITSLIFFWKSRK